MNVNRVIFAFVVSCLMTGLFADLGLPGLEAASGFIAGLTVCYGLICYLAGYWDQDQSK